MRTVNEFAYGCRRCEGALRRERDELRCVGCGETIPVVDGVAQFPVPEGSSPSAAVFDRLASIYETPAWFRPLYRLIGGPTAPVDDRSRIADGLETLETDQTLLDVACGTGRFTRSVADRVGQVVGVDVSHEMLERARRSASRAGLENATVARMSADRLWIADDSVDRAACCWALHLFPEPDAALAEIHRVLRGGGRFAGATLTDRYLLAAPPMRAAARQAIGAAPFALPELHARLREGGFDEIEFDRRGAALFFAARAE